MDTNATDANAVDSSSMDATVTRARVDAQGRPVLRWWLFWLGLAAFVVMAVTLITVSSLPPFPSNVPTWAFIVILGSLLVALGGLALFIMEVADWDMHRPQ